MDFSNGSRNVDHLTEILGQVGIGVAVATFDGIITYVNDEWARMHEYPPDSLIGTHLSIFHSKRQMAEDVEPFNVIVQKTGRNQGKIGHVTSSGREFPTLMTTTLLSNDQGQPAEMVAVARDITDLERAQEALEIRGRYLTCLSRISALMIGSKDVMRFLPEVMQLLGETASVSRTYLFKNRRAGDDLVCYQLAYWERDSAPAPPHEMTTRHEYPYRKNGLERWVAVLGRGDIISGNVRDFPEPERNQLGPYSIKSLLLIPLFVSGRWFGYIGFDCCMAERTWADEEVALLRTAAAQISAGIENHRLLEEVLLDAEILEQSNRELTKAYEETLEGWAQALEMRDSDTEGHTRRVADQALRIGKAMELSEEALTHLHRGALLHDIGKMALPDHILGKSDTLTEKERETVQQHPIFAERMLSRISYLRPALAIPCSHHERWDGSGYPLGLKGEAIPLAARIFAVVDVWDALTSNRPYRRAWSREKTIDYIREHSGSEFDPTVVETFLRMIEQDG